MGLRVEDQGGSESRPVAGRIGVATSPHPKGGRLPWGVGGRETSANRRGLGCRFVGEVVTALAGAPAATEVSTPRLFPANKTGRFVISPETLL
jgi:hypothetical protein